MSLSQFDVLGKLGEGAFATVFKVRRKSDNQIYALKKVKFGPLSAKEKENALNEVRILASFEHPNIVAYKEAFFDEGTCLCIITEFAEGGDILGKIESHKKMRTRFTEQEIWDALIQICYGLLSLHQKNILHRDIKVRFK
jgi:NIMA (never in mitosis gene a)-related kinase 1/4/5